MHPLVKSGLATALDGSGVLGALRRSRARRGGIVLGFHRVLPAAEIPACYDPEVAITDSLFADLLCLLRSEFHVVSLRELLDGPESDSGRQRVALTFDDGWIDTFTVAMPLMRQAGVSATVFVCPGLLEVEGAMLPEERFARIWHWCAARAHTARLLGDLKTWEVTDPGTVTVRAWGQSLKGVALDIKLRLLSWLENHYSVPVDAAPRFLTWDQATILLEQGFEIGSHTSHHATLTAEPFASLHRELIESRAMLEQRLNTRCRTLAYPNGALDARVQDAAREAGYDFGFTIEPGLCTREVEPLAIPRLCLSNSLITDARGRFHPARVRFALQRISGGAVGLFNRPQVLTRMQQI